jgi:hypothetical protein
MFWQAGMPTLLRHTDSKLSVPPAEKNGNVLWKQPQETAIIGQIKILHSLAENMAKRSSYQQNVIRNYYKNLDSIMMQRLGDLVTDLFLAEGKARVRLWKRVVETLKKLEIPKTQIDHLVAADNPTMLADLMKQLLEEK